MCENKYSELKEKTKTNPSELVNKLGFEKSLQIACDMLKDEKWDDQLHEYAFQILNELKRKFPENWNSSWRYDGLLGYACHIILDYDGRYAAYKRAFDKQQPAAPQLLIAMARCCMAPGNPPITEEEAVSLVKQAIKDKLYIEGVELLKGLYKSMGNIEEQKRWENILEKVKEGGIHLPELIDIPYNGNFLI